MIRLAIVEDNKVHAAATQESIDRYGAERFSVSVFGKPEDLDASGFVPDIAILDIELPGENGIAYARRLTARLPHCAVIFLTSYINYAVDAYTANHVYFVTKDSSDTVLLAALKKAEQWLAFNRTQKLSLPQKDGQVVISQAEICVLERIRRITRVALIDGTEYTTSIKLEDLLEKLDKQYYVRCHQSYVINLAQVRKLRRMDVELNSGELIPVSRRWAAHLQQSMSRYVAEET